MNKNIDLSVSCVIPMYNEEDSVEAILRAAENSLSQLVYDWEIIVVESGSTDSTREKISRYIKNKSNIYAVHQVRREGMGSALREGYKHCNKKLVWHLEADSPFEMKYFRRALPILAENDCVVGYRIGTKENDYKWFYHSQGKINVAVRSFFHIGYNLILRIFFGLVVRDVNFSFKIFKREHLMSLTLNSKGWFIDAEILLELRKKGIFPIEMPIEYKDRNRGASSISLSTPFKIIREMFAYKLRSI